MTADVVSWPGRAPEAPADVPSKCKDADAAGSPANPCLVPGTLLRCLICPDSPNYYLREAA